MTNKKAAFEVENWGRLFLDSIGGLGGLKAFRVLGWMDYPNKLLLETGTPSLLRIVITKDKRGDGYTIKISGGKIVFNERGPCPDKMLVRVLMEAVKGGDSW